MDVDLNEMLVFTRVVEAGSFTRAARDLGVPTSTVSRRVSRLEDRLGVRLLYRTTRKLSLTDAGRLYYDRGARVIQDAEDTERVVAELTGAPRGLLRVTAPEDIGDAMWAFLDRFLATYPEVRLEVLYTERYVDLVGEGIDVAVRGGPRPDSTALVARKLTDIRRMLVASPAYLARRGCPQTPRDLREHDCVIAAMWAPHGNWTLSSGRRKVQVPVRGRLTTNQHRSVVLAAVAGHGIAQVLAHGCGDEIERGELVEVLPGSCLPGGSLWAMYATRTHLLPTVRAFVEFAGKHFTEHVAV